MTIYPNDGCTARTLKGEAMRFGLFLVIAFVLLVLWVGSFVIFHVAGALIHLLLLFAIIALVIHLFSGAKGRSNRP